MRPLYPLSAVAHQEELLLALSLLAVAPEVGGLLIRGDRGAAKSTAARALARLLPPLADGQDAPFVNLPLGATEDRVVGTLDVEAALRGEARLKPGLMAQADGGLLYLDEVNLLPDHLVDVLLDAAAMGVARVQRDGLSAEQSARFALIGSMNPEEGSLRPQFLDRFGLCVDVQAPLQAPQRAEIVRRRMRFEAQPHAFLAEWQADEDALAARLSAARALWPQVRLPEALLKTIAALSAEAGVRSLRADLVMHRAARALSALEERLEVTAADVHRVAALVLRHRRDPRQAPPPAPSPELPPELPPPESPAPPTEGASSRAGPPEEVFAPMRPQAPLALPPSRLAGRQRAGALTGERVVGGVPDPQAAALHLPATLRAALGRSAAGASGFKLGRDDLRSPVYAPLSQRRVLFVADASGSMGTQQRMGLVKGALLDVLSSQEQRECAALITFRGPAATLVLPWTTDAAQAQAAITAAPTGGRTPLAHALRLAAEVLSGERSAELVLLTDGRANVALRPGSDPWADALSAAAALKGIKALVVDTEAGHLRLGRAAQLASVMDAAITTLEGQP